MNDTLLREAPHLPRQISTKSDPTLHIPPRPDSPPNTCAPTEFIYRLNGCYSASRSAMRWAIHSSISVSTQAEERGPILTGLGKSPLAALAYISA